MWGWLWRALVGSNPPPREVRTWTSTGRGWSDPPPPAHQNPMPGDRWIDRKGVLRVLDGRGRWMPVHPPKRSRWEPSQTPVTDWMNNRAARNKVNR